MRHKTENSKTDPFFFEPRKSQLEKIEDVELLAHRMAFRQAETDLEELPWEMQSAERLLMAVKLVEDAAYTIAHEMPRDEASRLFLIAADLEREMKRIAKQLY